jgi:DNA-binding beta-propeller fold protein YncE
MTTAAALIGLLLGGPSLAADPPPLTLEAKIPLGTVKGRIDHMAFDPDRGLLFVAELGNDSVAVVDLENRTVMHRIGGLNEPQGLAYHAATGTLYVANAGDGSLRLFQAADFAPLGRIELGADADNIRLDPSHNRIVVGYGKGALAMIDPTSRRKTADIALRAHPESFQFDETGSRIFVNVPDAQQIAVVDVASGRQAATLDTSALHSNFAMAVDPSERRLLIAFRDPARLMVYGTETGKLQARLDTCSDADDLFVDPQRHRVYVSCGQGTIDVFAQASGGYEHIAGIPTTKGARTSLFVSATDRLYLAVRASGAEPAAIWVFRPSP